MQLFTDNSFFIWLAVLSIPAIYLGCREKSLKWYGLFVTLVFIWLAMGSNLTALCNLAAFTIIEYAVVHTYLTIRTRKGRVTWQYRIFLLLSIAPLTIYKLLGLIGNKYHIFAFLGLSYMTFKAVQMVIEIYDGVIKKFKTSNFFYLMLFFPTVTSGPIDRSRRFDEDIDKVLPRAEYLELLGEGIYRILKGMMYKIVIAAGFYTVMNYFGTGGTWYSIAIYFYTYGFYLFFDFAGYSSMAIGVSYIFGIKTPENFNAPFVSKDIKEFWNRWHMTLSFWFRDFLFSRVTMSLVRSRKIKNKMAIASVAFMINMFVMGVWHGLESNYIVYGLYHGVLLSLCEIFQKKSKFYKAHKKDKWFIALSWFITFNLVMLGFFIFSGRLGILLFKK
ncbi:D-alanyl-lipoteichoic acid biosynthesis protein DltB [Mogibacterium timidum]|uniref:D-alanyl-lipoteichoic acid biosynthesis protein DltB n=1 Tax=Mogibacterium timidum TaxID=35519 RepID=UPI0023548BDE|nr:D-alanyl-lipoteichoic acid biosynthesis protein DltB [Mogibacterium timidum]